MVGLQNQDNYIVNIAKLDDNNNPIMDNDNNIIYEEYKRFKTHNDILLDSKIKQLYPELKLSNIRNLCSNSQIGKNKYKLIKIEKLFKYNKSNNTRKSYSKSYHHNKKNFKLYVKNITINPDGSETHIWKVKDEYDTLIELCNAIKDIYPDITSHKCEMMKKNNITNVRTSNKYNNIKIEKIN